MSSKVSTRKGNSKKPGQKYQNRSAFTHNRKSKLTEKILSLPVRGLCKRCHEIVEWRKKYRKYKSLTVPKKCVSCGQKSIKDAYHIICNKCAHEKDVCAKCQGKEEIIESKHKTHEQQNREQQLEENLIASLSERQRRSYFRKLERGDDEGAEKILEKARNAEEDDDDWSFGESELEDDDEDEEEELEELEDEEDEEDDEISEGVSKMNMLAKEE